MFKCSIYDQFGFIWLFTVMKTGWVVPIPRYVGFIIETCHPFLYSSIICANLR